MSDPKTQRHEDTAFPGVIGSGQQSFVPLCLDVERAAAVFLDKDGTLIEDVPFNVDPARMRLTPGAGEALGKLQAAGYKLIVVSNQSGVARGLFPEAALREVEGRLGELLGAHGVTLDGFYYCPHHPDGVVPAYALACSCRKPAAGLVLRAASEHGIDLEQSWLIGDILNDVEAGHRAGCRAILLDNGNETEWELSRLRQPDFVVSDLCAATDRILCDEVVKVEAEHGADFPDQCSVPTEEEVNMNARIMDLAQRFAGLHLLVIGEAMLDSYLDGYTDRLSREAPVPVVTVTERKDAGGGAANTAVNVTSLGGKVTFLSVLGDDEDGQLLRDMLESRGVNAEQLVVERGRRTLAKRRVSAGGQMLVRFDQGDTDAINAESESRLIEQLSHLFNEVDGVIISDYGYGVLTPRVLDALEDFQAWHPKMIVADARSLEQYRRLGVTAVKPNYGEAVKLLGLPKVEGACARAEQIAPHADRMLEMTGAQIAAITLDTEGALVCERGNAPYRTYSEAQPDSKAAGAGDTFVSALALSLLAGAGTEDAAEIAQAAARIVVAKPGTTTCTVDELKSFFLGGDKFYADPNRLAERLTQERTGCRRVVFTNGCFDILHRGHITYLNQAKALGDVLVVAVNTDESVQRLKGPTRPINGLEDRLQVLAGLSSVDFLIAFDDPTPARLLEILKPDVFVKGGDYTRETLPEAAVVESYGGSVQILPYIENRSTTGMIARIQESYTFPIELTPAQQDTAASVDG